jgi:hypothetical protein
MPTGKKFSKRREHQTKNQQQRRDEMKKQKMTKKRFLGVLCDHKHNFERTGKSLRYSNCGTCCTCNALSVDIRHVEQKEYRDAHKNKMKRYQKKYRKDKKRKAAIDKDSHQPFFHVGKSVLKPKKAEKSR